VVSDANAAALILRRGCRRGSRGQRRADGEQDNGREIKVSII
jgi:hypothetical protein